MILLQTLILIVFHPPFRGQLDGVGLPVLLEHSPDPGEAPIYILERQSHSPSGRARMVVMPAYKGRHLPFASRRTQRIDHETAVPQAPIRIKTINGAILGQYRGLLKGPKTSCFNLERTCSTSCRQGATPTAFPKGAK